MNELQALQTLATSPRFIAAVAAVVFVVGRRKAILAGAKRAIQRLRSLPSAGHFRLRENLLPLACLGYAAVLLAGQRGCDVTIPWPNIPSIVVTDGPRQLVILHETGEQSPAFKSLAVNLRDGAAADYLKAKGHTCLILDDEAEGGDGQPLKIVTDLKALGVPLPGLFITDQQGKVLVQQTLAATATADEVLAALKGVGG